MDNRQNQNQNQNQSEQETKLLQQFETMSGEAQQLGKPFSTLAHAILLSVPQGQDRDQALAKLVEVKEAAVRGLGAMGAGGGGSAPTR